MTDYVVATVHPWNVEAFHRRTPNLPGTWHLITESKDLDVGWLSECTPRYVFFPHWSWKVPAEVLEAVECVCFHMTDVPYGRGGSPLQNLIERGFRETVMSALCMVNEMDAGPVYMKAPMTLNGSAQSIFMRAADLTYDMIEEIIVSEPEPIPQQGEPTYFARRTPSMSVISENIDVERLIEHIRMLDADGYPRAYLDYGKLRLEFSNAGKIKDDGTMEAKVVFHLRENEE